MANRKHSQRKHATKQSDMSPVKILFRIFQAMHHLIVFRKADSDPDHPLLMNYVSNMSSVLKVAGAYRNPDFQAKMKKCNLDWRNGQIKNVIDHYQHQISFEQGALTALNISKEAMKKHLKSARQWAKRHFQKKYNDSEFSKVETFAYKLTKEATPTDKDERSESAQVTNQGGARPKDLKSPSPAPPRSQKPETTRPQPTGEYATPRNSRKRRPEASPEISPADSRDSKQQRGDPLSPRGDPLSPHVKTAPASTKSAIDFGFGSRFRPLATDVDVVTPSSVKRKKGATASPSSPDTTPKRGRQDQNTNNGGSPSLHPVWASAKGGDASRTPLSPKENVSFEERSKSKAMKFKTSDKVTCFDKLPLGTKGKKVTEYWQIPKVTKPILIIGTSNLKRIENVERNDAQILSYSGLKLGQLERMLNNFQHGNTSNNPGMKPAHVIIMAGICDMNLKFRTNKGNISKIYSAINRQFTGCKVSFCQIPMKENLFTHEQSKSIRDLNEAIQHFCKDEHNCIPVIEDFEVDPAEPIHWTPKCADRIIKHIFDHLKN